MWEFTTIINIKYKRYLNYILREIGLSKINVISVLSFDSDLAKLTIAVDVKSMQKLANILVDAICNVILLVHKKQYFKNNINLSKLDETSSSAFLKALVMFDSAIDKQEIKQEIILHKQLNIDSFYNFKLGFLREKWSEILNIVNANVYISNSNNFLELLKFLVNNLDSSVPLINVYFKDNKFIVYDNKNRPIKLKDVEETNEANLISQLIELSPKVINLYCSKNLSTSTFKVIYYLFDKKINLIN